MNKNIFFVTSCILSFATIVRGNDCHHVHDTHNVGHQFYDALVDTPKDALVKGAVATKDLGKELGHALVFSHAAHDLKDAAKELVIETPVKTAYALKNGTVKVIDAAAHGVKAVYNVTVKKPAHAIKDTAHKVAQSDFVQGTKETLIEVKDQLKDAGHDVIDATKYGVHKVYHVAIEKPVGAVKAATHYLLSDEDHHEHEHHSLQSLCVMVVKSPLVHSELSEQEFQTQHDVTTVIVTPASLVTNEQKAVTCHNHPAPVQLEIAVNHDVHKHTSYTLSPATLCKLKKAYNAVCADLNK